VLSAYIRLAEVGVGCEPWPGCYAVLNPELEQKGITVLTAAGKDMAYRGARVAHRYIASVLGLFIIVIFAASLHQRDNRTTSLALPTAILALTLFLSLLGYYTPTRSNPLVTMGNLVGGMSLLALLWWILQRSTERVGDIGAGGLRPFVVLGLCLVFLQILLGGWSSANYASTACPGLLSCTLPWLSSDNYVNAYALQREVSLDGNGRVIREASLGALSMTHRGMALVTAAYLAWMVRRAATRSELKATCIAISCFSVGLIAVGVTMIWFELPLPLLSLHNALAAGLLLGCVNLVHRLTPQPANLPPLRSPHAGHSG
jgi:cytochrome c oxidase assembly protein subunit 15